MPNSEDQVRREAGVHGTRWAGMHRGYFSHPAIADPLVHAAAELIARDNPAVVADLGGGTGMVLRQILQEHPEFHPTMVDVDASAKQLAEVSGERLRTLNASALEIRREDLNVGEGRLMLLMRSLLHYFGQDGQHGLLRHLRGQMRVGEAMIHQTACFVDEADSRCANRLYELMRSPKWYPTQGQFREILARSGWTTVEIRPAPPLALESAELAERYQLTPADVAIIRENLSREFPDCPTAFVAKEGGFIAWLHYAIFICRAE